MKKGGVFTPFCVSKNKGTPAGITQQVKRYHTLRFRKEMRGNLPIESDYDL